MLLDNYKKQSPIIGVAGLGGGINSYIFLSSGDDGNYVIARSLRFNSGDSAYLSRTPSSASNRKTFTFSCWLKKGTVTDSQRVVFSAFGGSGNAYVSIDFRHDSPRFIGWNGSSVIFEVKATRVLRDPSAWYHMVWSVDTAQATAANRAKLYINGVQETDFQTSSYPSQNTDLYVNTTNQHEIGQNAGTSQAEYDGFLADVHFIDGQQLAATDFGSTDSDGVWQPGTYSGSHGTNGFHLDFKNYGSTTNLGKDSAGSNNWAVNNFSVTAGASNDSLLDHPIQESPTDTGKGAEVRGNYATLNPLDPTTVTLSNGNLDCVTNNAATHVRGTIGISSGKWYWEVVAGSSSELLVGICTSSLPFSADMTGGGGYSYYSGNGNKYTTSGSSYGASWTTGDTIGVAFDADAGTLTFYKNGSSQGQAFSGLTSGPFFPAASDGSSSASSNFIINFGQREFEYEAPSGFKCLNTANLSTPSVADGSDFFEPLLYTGNATARNITGLSFSPDLVFLKNRDRANYNWYWVDILRGSDKNLFSNSSEGEQNAARLSSLNSDGFGLTNHGGPNYSGDDYVAYCFDGGSSNTSVSAGGANAAAYNQSSTWSNNWTASGNGFGSQPPSYGFDNDLDNNINNAAGGQYITWNTTSYTLSGSLEINCYSSSGVYDVYVNGVKASDTPSSRGWIQCGSFNDINEIQFGGTSYNSSTGLGSAGILIYEIKVGGRTLIDYGVSSLPNVPTVATTYRANPNSGFSVVTWAGDGNDNASVVHGLNSEPGIVIIKNRSTATSWHTYVRSLDPNGRYQLYLNSNGGSTDFGAPGFFNADYARINLIGGSSGGINASGYNFVAWCFAPVAGYSAMGSYTGNGSTDGTFVHTGFKPAFLLTKRTDTSENWEIRDNKRNPHNRTNRTLFPHTGGTEDNGSVDFDFLSNGFKLRNANGSTNASGGTYMYYAIAEHPFKTARAR